MVYKTLIKVSTFVFLLISCLDSHAQKDNLEENKAVYEKAHRKYQKKLDKKPGSAKPHLNFARELAKMTSRASGSAWKYYAKALVIDSLNSDLYVETADHLIKKHSAYEQAIDLYQSALVIENKEITQQKLEKAKKELEERDEIREMRSIGTTDKRSYKHDIPYREFINLDSLSKLTKLKDNDYYFPELLERFKSGEEFGEYKTYMLLVGFTTTDNYFPHDRDYWRLIYNQVKEGKPEDAIKLGEKYLDTLPLSTSLMRELMFAHRVKGETKQANEYQRKIRSILDAMIYTGDGTMEKPYMTFWISTEYLCTRYMSYIPSGKQSLEQTDYGPADALDAYNPDNESNILIYFNVNNIFATYRKVFQKK